MRKFLGRYGVTSAFVAAVCLIVAVATFGVLRLTPTASAANPPAGYVTLSTPSSTTLSATMPYLLDDGTAAASGTLGVDSVAYFDAATGTLTLQDYHFGRIEAPIFGGPWDLQINLVGTNTITSIASGQVFGIYNNNTGDLIISSSTGGSLAITVSSTSDSAMGITTNWNNGGVFLGDTIISGDAHVTINAATTSSSHSANGIHTAGGNVAVLDDASLAITASAPGTGSIAATAIYSRGETTFNTTGDILVDASDPANDTTVVIYAIGGTTLTRANTLKIILPVGGFESYPAISYNPANFIVTSPESNSVLYSWDNRTAVTFTAVQTGGVSTTWDTTGIVLTFNQAVTGLTASDITVDDGTGSVTTGVLVGSGTTWTLDVPTVDLEGYVTVKVADFGTFKVTTTSQSVMVYKKTTTVTPPTAPIGLTATPGDGEITLNWTAPASDGGEAITEYYYFCDETATYPASPVFNPIPYSDDTTVSYLVTGLTNDTEYTCQVMARNSSYLGTASSKATATPTAAAPVTPLTFASSPAFDIPAMTVGTPISPINVAGGAAGGTPPYSFSAIGLPAGISISPAGIISGTPTTTGTAGTVTITVTDSDGTTRTIRISYGAISAAASSGRNPRTGDINTVLITATSMIALAGVVLGAIRLRKLATAK
ncbi:fibronectin type III domain-containing protein [Candidatus Saccharibacteria bacterium]|nr:fibronectin type III domain-containing protein [Candidatus Saccharibacteria bacterium]